MTATINNEWITLSEQRNGVTVQRKFAGLDSAINEDDTVKHCIIKYYERELYPNGEVIKVIEKKYTLQNLAYTECRIDEVDYYMNELNVLDSFIQSVGNTNIINPSRLTLTDVNVLPLNVEDNYPLKRDTREKIIK